MIDVLPFALGIAVQPLPLIGFLLVLNSARGARNGAAFLASWLVSFVAIIVLTVELTDSSSSSSSPSKVTLVAQTVVGLALLLVAWRRMRKPKTDPGPRPAWMDKVDAMGPWSAAGLGFLIQPWALITAGAAKVDQAGLSSTQTWLTMAGFCLLSTATLFALEGYAVLAPERSGAQLTRLREWIELHNNQVMTGIAAVVGVWLLAQGLLGLALL